MPNKLLKLPLGVPRRKRSAWDFAYYHQCYDCGWDHHGGHDAARTHAMIYDHHTEMTVTRHYYYEGRPK